MIFWKKSILIITVLYFSPFLGRLLPSPPISGEGYGVRWGEALSQVLRMESPKESSKGVHSDNATFGQTTSDISKMDTIFFLNGEIRAVKIVDTVYHLVRFLPEKRKRKPKVLDVEKDRVFSLKFSDGQERIMYFHDSALGNVFTVLEAQMFMLGEREANMHYRNKWPFVIGFVVGAGSPIALSNAIALSPIAPSVIPIHTLIPVIKGNTKKIENKNYLQYDTYLMGYEKVARKKNFMHSLLGAGIGFAFGFGVWAILK